MMFAIKEKDLQLVHRHADELDPHTRLFFQTLETFIIAQQSLNKQQQMEIINFLTKVGASDFKKVFEKMIASVASEEICIPVKIKKEMLTVQEVADLCGVSMQMVRRACEDGKIIATRGRKRSWLILKKEFLESEVYKRWMNEKRTTWDITATASEILSENEHFIKGIREAEIERKSGDQ